MPQVEAIYKGLWKGIDTSLPETDIDPSATPFCENFILRKGELRSRFVLQNLCKGPDDGTQVLGATSFVDSNGLVHTIACTQVAVYQFSSAFATVGFQGNPWLSMGNFQNTIQNTAPFQFVNLQGKIFFTNGSHQVWFWDGMANAVGNAGQLAGGEQCGSLYIMELGARIVLAATTETSSGTQNFFPFRVRWSAVNLASNTFDPSVNIGAGFNDMFDCPDTITGVLPVGRVGYIFRSNGISEMLPTSGQGLAFDFNHLWASDRGIGNAFPQTLAGFGPLGIFGSGEGFYKITPNNFEDIGKGATDEILTDLFERSGTAQATILPYFAPFYPYTVYALFIQQGNDTKAWFYDLKEGSWAPMLFKNKLFTCKPKYLMIA